MTLALTGTGISRGISIGDAHLVSRDLPDVREATLAPRKIPGEVRRYQRALERARAQLQAVLEEIPSGTPREIREFIDIHLLMLADAPIAESPVRLIREQGINAEWALKLQGDKLTEIFESMDDSYLRTRKEDVNQVIVRVLQALSGDGKDDGQEMAPVNGRVIVADDLAAADIALYCRHGAAGFITEFGSPVSHASILARSLRAPAIAGIRNARAVLAEHDHVIVDGERGVVLVNADRASRRYFSDRQRQLRQYFSGLSRFKGKRAVTQCGTPVSLQANIERPADVALVKEAGASGIGLFRTEFLFMNRAQPPDEEEQLETYLAVVQAFPRKPVTLRTLDLGADKQVDGGRGASGPAAANPALGLRAIRLCLRERSLFRTQLRALLRASAYGRVRIMVPMLTVAREVFQVRHIIDALKRELSREGHKVARDVPIGGMIEVPAAAIAAPLFAKYLDFLSIGTNDLIQYTLAIDRIDDSVSYLYDPTHPALLKLLQTVLEGGRRHGKPVAMCGEMAGDTRYTRLLLGLGLREFSMHPGKLLEAKQVIAQTRMDSLAPYIRRIQRTTNPRKLAHLVREMNL